MHVAIANSWWRGKRSRHYRCMNNPQSWVSGKRPIQVSSRHHPSQCLSYVPCRHLWYMLLGISSIWSPNSRNVLFCCSSGDSEQLLDYILRVALVTIGYLDSRNWHIWQLMKCSKQTPGPRWFLKKHKRSRWLQWLTVCNIGLYFGEWDLSNLFHFGTRLSVCGPVMPPPASRVDAKVLIFNNSHILPHMDCNWTTSAVGGPKLRRWSLLDKNWSLTQKLVQLDNAKELL